MRKRRKTADTDTGMFADISFQLLIFFMVVTSFSKNHRLEMTLPPIIDNPFRSQISADRVLEVFLNDSGEYLLGDKVYTDVKDLPLDTELNRIGLTKKKGVIKINMTPKASYKSYLNLIAQLKIGILTSKDKRAFDMYGKGYPDLNKQEKEKIDALSRISITEKEVNL